MKGGLRRLGRSYERRIKRIKKIIHHFKLIPVGPEVPDKKVIKIIPLIDKI
jgi:hypothetical protein